MVKNPNWQAVDQLVIYKAWPRIGARDYRETNPASGMVEALNPGPPDYNTASALNHSYAASTLAASVNCRPLFRVAISFDLSSIWSWPKP